jgi:tRNA(Ile)-lysidine synthase
MQFATLKDFCEAQGFSQTYWIGFSGGLDSHVLLHLLADLRKELPLKLNAIYVNHHLSPNAESWGEHCKKVCAELRVDFLHADVDAKSSAGESPEEVARKVRYEIFKNLMQPQDLFFTAHHQDDQAETVLLQLFRGAGPKGLSAMPFIKKLGEGFQVRPLLNLTRKDLENYAAENKLHWIEDESNANKNFSRNFIRHDIMPILKKRWPAMTATLARVAMNCADAQEILDETAMFDLASTRGKAENALSVTNLLGLTPARQRQVLRLWLDQAGFPIPSNVKIQQLQRDVLMSRLDKAPHVKWEGCEIRRYRDDIFAMQWLQDFDREKIHAWDLQQSLSIHNLGVLTAIKKSSGLRVNISNLTIRFRQGGEVCHLRGCTHTLKNLFQENDIPPWKRDRIPLVYSGTQLIAAAGYFISEDFRAGENETGYEILLREFFFLTKK